MGLSRRGFPLTLCFVASVAYSPPAAVRMSLPTKCHGPCRGGSCSAASADPPGRASAHARVRQRNAGLHHILQPLHFGRSCGFAGGALPARAGGRMAMSGSSGHRESVDIQTLFDFERNGHVAIRQLIEKDQAKAANKALIGHLNSKLKEAYVFKMELLAADCEDDELLEMSKKCKTAQQAKEMLKDWCDENDMEVPFLQDFNVHRSDCPEGKVIEEIAKSQKLGEIASDILGVDSVRLYQTCSFFKAVGQGETSWHADLATAPFDTNNMVTCWIALTDINGFEDAPLEFASRSHKDVALPFWYDEEGIYEPSGDPREYEPVTHLPLHVGDSTWHHGWLFHASPPNESKKDRLALAITYVASDAVILGNERRRKDPEGEDVVSYEDWIKDVKPGCVASHPLTPIVFSRAKKE